MAPWLIKRKNLILWLLLTAGLGFYLSNVLLFSKDKSALLPGISTDGHYQIEAACDACHTEEPQFGVFTASGVTNKGCLACHKADLDLANDSHPVIKFKNPENAVFLEHIDAMLCITCHREHNEKITHEMAVTIPPDYCAHCHEVTLETRDSHKDLPYNSCATSGCHNYHDNTALFEHFQITHAFEPDINRAMARVPDVEALERWLAEGNKAGTPLTIAQADAPPEFLIEKNHVQDWHQTAHARAGVNCRDCHTAPDSREWVLKPDHTSCRSCHTVETDDFLRGKHGMRLALDLKPMTPGEARQPMKKDAAHHALSCTSCHSDHRFDRHFASTQACMQCHDDEHTRNYPNSPHAALWAAELNGAAPAGTGVSCATCHMPREERVVDDYGTEKPIIVQHNQSANLRPNEKMIRGTCMQCHGLGFTMNAIADKNAILSNFSQRPSIHVESIDWSVEAALKRGDGKVLQRKQAFEKNDSRSPGSNPEQPPETRPPGPTQ